MSSRIKGPVETDRKRCWTIGSQEGQSYLWAIWAWILQVLPHYKGF
jgi:hypothetical protein